MYRDEILSMPEDAKFLLVKRGLYWGPNYCGYTGVKAHAGVYARDQAASRVHNDGEPVSAIPYETAPEYSPKCDIHIKAEHLEARVKELEEKAPSMVLHGIQRGKQLANSGGALMWNNEMVSPADYARKLVEANISAEAE